MKGKGEKEQGKKKGKNLASAKATAGTEEETNMDDLDDMAFLDAEIERVQTSHGRKVEGKGQYCTIINGILIGQPPKRDEKQPDNRAASALSAKLQQARRDRVKKPGKKKR